MAEPYAAYAPHYDRQGLSQWGRALIDFTLEVLLPRHGSHPRTALDLACGTGTVALALARAGLAVVGLDRSAAMLALAAGKARAAGARCDFVRGDLRTFAFARPFDLITCAYDSLNYLTEPDDLRAAFACVRRALAPGGLFVGDLTTARAYADEPAAPETFDLGTVAYTWATAWEPTRRRATTTLTVTTRDGDRTATVTERHAQRPYERAEVEATLRAAGLRPLGAFAARPLLAPTLDPPDDATARIIYVAEPDTPEGHG